MKRCTSWIGLLMACIIGACSQAAAAQPTAPPDAYKIEAEYTQKSPDGAISIEQYQNRGDWTWQFWMRREGAFTLLDTDPGYAADFIFTKDQNWIIREQKIGSGTSTLHLYHLTPEGYVRASTKPLGELAWDFMKSRPDWRKLVKAPEYHDSAYLADGLEENYRGVGVDWPANRYLVISLSADAAVKGRQPM